MQSRAAQASTDASARYRKGAAPGPDMLSGRTCPGGPVNQVFPRGITSIGSEERG